MTEADAVVLGAGHNGLTLATALGRAGLSVVLLESEAEPGGMARPDRALGERHVHHPHATFLGYHSVMPLRDDLRRAGLRWVVPEVQHAIVFPDGRPGIALHRRDRSSATWTSVARYSRADADLLVALIACAATLTGPVTASMTTAPSHAMAGQHLAAIRKTYAGLPVLDRLGSRSVIQLLCESFASPEVRAFLMLLAHELGGDVTEAGGDAGFLGVTCRLIADRAVPVGGMGALVAAHRTLARNAGVDIRCGAAAEHIEVADCGAVAVRLPEDRVTARKLVASTLPRDSTLALAGAGATSSEPQWHRGENDVVKQHFVLHEPPRFTSARDEPDIQRAVQVFFGWDTPEAVVDRVSELHAGALPRPGGAILRPSLADATQSRAPHHLLAVDSTFPAVASLGDAERDAVQDSFPEATLRRLSHYAPNVSADSVSASFIAPLRPATRQVALDRLGPAHYRVPGIGRLYLGGADRHPGGGVHGACGWNAAHVALADIAT
ncbi:phytoene desaturase family protein [Streptomyces sp. NPDC057694]|uniref:phytoene desaturase family protein n=1 Tax=Streptomyces sp. NPDC057694 TaxID=3346216 RepID=UPI0036741AA5